MNRKNTKIGRRIRRGRDNTPRLCILDMNGPMRRGICRDDNSRRISICLNGGAFIS